MRDKKTGYEAIQKAVANLEKTHSEHIAHYGEGLGERLTGKHETCDIQTFRYGELDRGASVRIPNVVVKNRCGYIEDRRPNANMDPYIVTRLIIETIHEA